MAAVDSTFVLLALLSIAQDLQSDFLTMVRVIIAYLLVSTSFVLSLDHIVGMFGQKKTYNVGFIFVHAGFRAL
jgi:divalent metal cation (Fe/Co/Zn/Cd) transporter